MTLLLYNQYTSHGCSYNEIHEISQQHETNKKKMVMGQMIWLLWYMNKLSKKLMCHSRKHAQKEMQNSTIIPCGAVEWGTKYLASIAREGYTGDTLWMCVFKTAQALTSPNTPDLERKNESYTEIALWHFHIESEVIINSKTFTWTGKHQGIYLLASDKAQMHQIYLGI